MVKFENRIKWGPSNLIRSDLKYSKETSSPSPKIVWEKDALQCEHRDQLDCRMPRLKRANGIEFRATSHTRLRASDQYTSSTLIGGKGRAQGVHLLLKPRITCVHCIL